MKTNKQQKGILLTAAAMLAVIAVVVIIGLSLPEREEYIQGEVETTDYRVSCKVPSRVCKSGSSRATSYSKATRSPSWRLPTWLPN